jgi:type II secretory pathway component PulJ
MSGYVWLSLIIAGAALVVLAAVAASGIGPLTSLRRSASRMQDVTDEIESLRRATDVLRTRAETLRGTRHVAEEP